MPYYAVGYGDASYKLCRPGTPEEISQWEREHPGQSGTNLRFAAGHVSASETRVSGPFTKAKKAWREAIRLQKGASMRQPCPLVVKLGINVSLKTLRDKLDMDEIVFNKEYDGQHGVHTGRFIKKRWRP